VILPLLLSFIKHLINEQKGHVMQALAISRSDYGANRDLLTNMHRLRHRVFKERLDWSVSVVGDMEIDVYDGLGPVYLMIVTDNRQVVGSVRLLPTTGPNMLADTFSTLLAGETAPNDERLLESSRFCVDTAACEELGSAGLHKTTFMLLSAVVEWGLITRSQGIVTVTDLRMERILRRAGWTMDRIGRPQAMGTVTALAGTLEVSEAVARRIRLAGGLETPVLSAQSRLAA
jgi:acyl homoserine lactone synthase